MGTAQTSYESDLDYEKAPGHWILARMGKRVLRPGGMKLTREMIDHLRIEANDEVIEFAPGLGVTARLTLEKKPVSYTAIELDEAAAREVRSCLNGSGHQCKVGKAEENDLPDCSGTVVYVEAMLTMQTAENKSRIVREAARLLKSGGRYGIHELCLQPDDLSQRKKNEIKEALSQTLRMGARPLTVSEWREQL